MSPQKAKILHFPACSAAPLRSPPGRTKPSTVVSIADGDRAGVLARRNQLVEQYLPLVRPIAERVARTLPPSFELDDLISAGYVGLVAAATRYRPRGHGGTPFDAYARVVVRGAILDSIRRRNYTDATHGSLDNVVEISTSPVAEESFDTEVLSRRVRFAVNGLPPRLKRLVCLYYSEAEPTLAMVGESLSVGRARTTQLHSLAIAELRRRLHAA